MSKLGGLKELKKKWINEKIIFEKLCLYVWVLHYIWTYGQRGSIRLHILRHPLSFPVLTLSWVHFTRLGNLKPPPLPIYITKIFHSISSNLIYQRVPRKTDSIRLWIFCNESVSSDSCFPKRRSITSSNTKSESFEPSPRVVFWQWSVNFSYS